MRNLVLLFVFLTTAFAAFSQEQSITENKYQIGMFNASSSKKSFTFAKEFNGLAVQISSLPLFAQQFKVYSSLGLSGQLTINQSEYGKIFTYSGVQRITTKLGNKKEHINLGVGLGFKTKINQAVEFICQGGYSSVNVFKTNRNTVFNSEVGVYYHF